VIRLPREDNTETEKQQKTLKKQKKAATRLFWALFLGSFSLPLLIFSLSTGLTTGILIFSLALIICGTIFLNTITHPVDTNTSFLTKNRPYRTENARKETNRLTGQQIDEKHEESID